MIVYFDTSALVPLLIREPSSEACQRIWNSADSVVTSHLLYVETSAVLAQARRLKRIEQKLHDAALAQLEQLWASVNIVEFDHDVSVTASRLADAQALRAYDAVHCASALLLNQPDLVVASGDNQLLAAWRALGLITYDTKP